MELAQCSATVVKRIASPPKDQKRAVLFDLAELCAPFPTTPASLHSPSFWSPARRLFESGFDLACDRGDYSLEQQSKEICSRIHLTCTPTPTFVSTRAASSPNVTAPHSSPIYQAGPLLPTNTKNRAASQK